MDNTDLPLRGANSRRAPGGTARASRHQQPATPHLEEDRVTTIRNFRMRQEAARGAHKCELL